MPGFIEITSGLQAGTIIGLTEKGGSTSIQQSVKHARKGKPLSFHGVRSRQDPVRIYLRHPVKRLISAWRFFYPSKFPERQIPQHASFEQFVDHVLAGVRNTHWNPQLEMYDGCNIAELYKFERILETWPKDIPLRHLNASHFAVPLPSVVPRLAEVNEHYREDLAAWASLNET